MFEDHFGLTGRPFQLTPDPAFWFETATHRKAMAYLGFGLQQGEGFVVITGEIGAGKTTLMGHLLASIDPTSLNAIRMVSTALEADDLLRTVAVQLGVQPRGLAKAELLLAIERGLHGVARTGRRTLLVVDEAQALSVSAVEELRMLSNFQAGGRAMLQVVLLGQPEFRDRLHGESHLEQLRQRVVAIHHLEPMGPEEVDAYMAHRLLRVGWKGKPDFTANAFAAFHRASGGVPRQLNSIANRVMLHAALSGSDLIDADAVEAVVADMRADLPAPSARPTPKAVTPAPELVSSDSAPATPAVDHDTAARLIELEARVEEQDLALRRVLNMLVEWVEGEDARPTLTNRAA